MSISKGVPTFYSGNLKDDEIYWSYIKASFLGITFGPIHCIAWSFEFPTNTDRTLWRISSIVISGIPTALTMLSVFCLFSGKKMQSLLSYLTYSKAYMVISLMIIGPTLYIFARFTTLILSLIDLRYSPPGVYQTVDWAAFLPHI